MRLYAILARPLRLGAITECVGQPSSVSPQGNIQMIDVNAPLAQTLGLRPAEEPQPIAFGLRVLE